MESRKRLRRLVVPVLATVLAGTVAPLAAQLIGPGRGLGGRIGDTVDRVGGTVDRIGEPVETVEDALGEQVDVLGQTLDDAVDDIGRLAAAATELFVADIDPANRAVERDIWVVLVPQEFSEQIQGWGFTIRERRDLEGLDLVLLRVEAPDDRSMAETEQTLADDAPGTVVDFNHVYGPGQASASASATAGAGARVAGRSSAESPPDIDTVPPNALALGLIDSAIAADHEAFSDIAIVQQDFVPFKGERPREHGSAVASIAYSALRSRDVNRPLALYVASVFFSGDRSEPIATTGSLVAALAWLGSEDVEVINMSLTGPPNRVLEAALAASARRGTVVVAAVGNDGPAAAPLYPAAYDSVLGITAVDDDQRIYRHANRGPQVAFAALGVRVRGARADGGFRRDTGTSLAAPIAAAVIASELSASDETTEVVLRRLESGAIDLGAEGFDEVYGHGLIGPME